MRVVAVEGDEIGVILTREQAAMIAAALASDGRSIVVNAKLKYPDVEITNLPNLLGETPLYLVYDRLDDFARWVL